MPPIGGKLCPWPGRIMYKHWREVDPGSKILCRVFNTCLKLNDIPPSWKNSSTILIHKDGEVDQINNWRPIALSNTINKLFTKCLARKLAEWCEEHSILSSAQKGFTPYDGVIEHNFLINAHLERARSAQGNAFLAWLDVSNAFGSVPHEAIIHALRAEGTDGDFIEIVVSLYVGASSSILTEEEPSDPLLILCGVKQGCNLSGILFNFHQRHDQDLIDRTVHSLQRVALSLKASKCATLHLSCTTPVGSRLSPFFIQGIPVKALSDGDWYKYLGKPVGFSIRKDCSSINDALIDGHKIATSKLSQWQKLDTLREFFFPSLNFAMRTAQFPKTDWQRVESSMTKEIKEVLGLPLKASCSYLFGDSKQGACGIPEITKDADLYLVDIGLQTPVIQGRGCCRQSPCRSYKDSPPAHPPRSYKR
ncbi:retrovirus-related Pol polyprotein from type-1 retrotransposable element R2 [Trichonephila inaurata madagascariensis]|uniref:Retrovirus-related Pol polyprotein from type-1 retrotransposable element R2 n=1 Tax=Trichonephila inaurata madagascariensis TaxID=2747483 RepID=A0A8X6MGT3_9ARAC|nr:retrovirus-related Pol polyprotein from type-1 retrotransposable element R2 [Trichonephila inaurata madagascariensis]